MTTTLSIPESRDGRVVQFFGSADAMAILQEAVGNEQFHGAAPPEMAKWLVDLASRCKTPNAEGKPTPD